MRRMHLAAKGRVLHLEAGRRFQSKGSGMEGPLKETTTVAPDIVPEEKVDPALQASA